MEVVEEIEILKLLVKLVKLSDEELDAICVKWREEQRQAAGDNPAAEALFSLARTLKAERAARPATGRA